MFQDDHVVKILMKRCQEFKIIVKGQCTCSSWNFTFPQKFPQSIPWQPGDNSCAKIFWMKSVPLFLICGLQKFTGWRERYCSPCWLTFCPTGAISCLWRHFRFSELCSSSGEISIHTFRWNMNRNKEYTVSRKCLSPSITSNCHVNTKCSRNPFWTHFTIGIICTPWVPVQIHNAQTNHNGVFYYLQFCDCNYYDSLNLW